MPELPDIPLYIHARRPRIVGHEVRGVRLASPFLLLADRSLSRLLRADWPRTLDELERRRRG